MGSDFGRLATDVQDAFRECVELRHLTDCPKSAHPFKIHNWRWLGWPLSNPAAIGATCIDCGAIQGEGYAIPVKEILYTQSQMDAAITAEREREWQPIETAPKGPKVLVAYQNPLGKWRRVCARYYEPETLESELAWDGWSEPGWYEACEAMETIYQVEYEPTHWMPLPAPPAAAIRREVKNGK